MESAFSLEAINTGTINKARGRWPEQGTEALCAQRVLQWARQGGDCPHRQCHNPGLPRRTWDKLSSDHVSRKQHVLQAEDGILYGLYGLPLQPSHPH